ncbi:copper chaperone [Candidatus Thermokryptus mobilis]|uniref:Copper chaperone n=1 Tax=Candidatus Thermokryptus mobilis TaxID=1643428 RepID=A0A0S4N6E1_9BACT|nr:heavy metal-associated domain-containing protein [Candidatus Thermokryptus mobilis]CUU05649.1 copper chaperone [Candidatus Thermokryptus mobilis]
MNRLTLTVEGMTCHHCEMTVENAVKQLKNVLSAKADHQNKTLEIVYTGELKIEDVKQKVEEAGYRVLG